MNPLETALYKTKLYVDDIRKRPIKYTQPGSLTYLLFGKIPSTQSLNIKLGFLGEFMSKELVKASENCELLTCGVQNVNGDDIDIDLIWKNRITQTIHYRELKGNIQLDTEKIKSVIERVRTIEMFLSNKYPEYAIDSGILHWSVYERRCILSNNECLQRAKKIENAHIKVDHFKELVNLLDHHFPNEAFYSFFREMSVGL